MINEEERSFTRLLRVLLQEMRIYTALVACTSASDRYSALATPTPSRAVSSRFVFTDVFVRNAPVCIVSLCALTAAAAASENEGLKVGPTARGTGDAETKTRLGLYPGESIAADTCSNSCAHVEVSLYALGTCGARDKDHVTTRPSRVRHDNNIGRLAPARTRSVLVCFVYTGILQSL